MCILSPHPHFDVIDIVVENKHGEPSPNTGGGWSHFHLEKVQIQNNNENLPL